MDIICKITTAFLFCFSTTACFTQVAIPYDASADESAELAIESTDKGLLIPVLTINERNSINSPAEGLFVFDEEYNAIRYYNDTEWCAIGVMPQYTTAARPVSNAIEGALIYDTDLNQLLFYDGSAWRTLEKAP